MPYQPFVPHLINSAYKEKLRSLEAKFVDTPWNNLQFEKVLKRTLYAELSPDFLTFFKNLYQSQCENNDVSIVEKEILLSILQHAVFSTEPVDCIYDHCLTSLAQDRNCTRAADNLETRLSNGDPKIMSSFKSFELDWTVRLMEIKTTLNGVNAILTGDIRQGVSNIKKLVENLVDKLSEWIKVTPWVENSEAAGAILDVARSVHLNDNLAQDLNNALNYVFRLEQSFLKCLSETHNIADFEVFCMVLSTFQFEDETPEGFFFNPFNAFNSHPQLGFSFVLYDMAQNIEEPAAMLGSVGLIAGHEVSHSMIENAASPELIPYFSNDSMQCIQGQYAKTCEHFRENPCFVSDRQIDENGADMLGMRLAYSLFEDAYGDDIQKEYIKVYNKTITMQQLFFYSAAFTHCRGLPQDQPINDPHSISLIRANAQMQIPAFREAFQCDTDSEMVKSFTDECFIFGENAPETKKKFDFV
uniref:Peptidase_M13 domain-containing protein n=1 Tax=Caenorhabditis tropicalis TaxID=1561998 RepID=A0A1I7SYK6_9PELO